MSALDIEEFFTRWTWRFLLGWCAGGLAAIGWLIWRLTR